MRCVTEAPDPERDIPPPDESGVRVVARPNRFEARHDGYARARSASLPALLRWSRTHLGEGAEIVRLSDDTLMATIERMETIGLIPINAMLRWVGMRTRILKAMRRRVAA